MNTAAKEKMDADISRITIANEISPARIHIAEGEHVKSFFVVQVALKRKDFDERTIATISKLIPQNMLLVLECGGEAKLAIYHTKLMQTDWQQKDSLSIELKGLNLDTVWESIIVQVGGVQIESSNTLDEQIEVDDRLQRLEKEIDRLDRLARKEKQPKKKFELAQQIQKLKKELGELQ
ncbi:DUF4391 domain-containing protein, partial [Eubacteriales bacterium OttesenSCG-928-N14]|nr:DUF4391 domain-containing protein [Eubacteriales bacterium OttesenSCG-928-N14]